jgi:hypothetical protein
MPFQKGQSGNVRGRPKKGRSLTDILTKELAKKDGDTIPQKTKLAQTLIELAIKDKYFPAIKYLYDRVDGFPAATETIAVDTDVNYDAIREKVLAKLLS